MTFFSKWSSVHFTTKDFSSSDQCSLQLIWNKDIKLKWCMYTYINNSKAVSIGSKQRLIAGSNGCQQLTTAVSCQHIEWGCWQCFFSFSNETVKSNLNMTHAINLEFLERWPSQTPGGRRIKPVCKPCWQKRAHNARVPGPSCRKNIAPSLFSESDQYCIEFLKWRINNTFTQSWQHVVHSDICCTFFMLWHVRWY